MFLMNQYQRSPELKSIVNLISVSVRVPARTKHIQLGPLKKCFSEGTIYRDEARFKNQGWLTYPWTKDIRKPLPLY